MRRGLSFSVICLFQLLPVIALAQYSWFNRLTGDGDVIVVKICVQTGGNIIAVGNFQNNLTLDNEQFAGTGAFIICYNPNGALVWREIFSSPFTFAAVATDSQGNIYATAAYFNEAQIDLIHLTGNGFSNFLAKFNSTGVLQWVKNFSRLQEVFDLDVNDHGNIVLTSYVSGVIDLAGTPLTSGSFAAFCAFFNTDGDLKWTRLLGSDSVAYSSWPIAVAIDNSDNVFVEGKFSGSLKLDGHTISGNGNYTLFFAGLNSEGACKWLTPASRTFPPEYETASPPNGLIGEQGDLLPDEHGNVIAYGEYYLSMQIAGEDLPDNVGSPYAANFFLLKLKHDGTKDWATGILTKAGYETSENIVWNHNSILVSGVEGNEYYFAGYDQLGQPLGDRILLPVYADLANGLAVDANDSIYLSGRSLTKWYDPPTFGFVLKYSGANIALPGTPAKVSGAGTACTTNSISLSTNPVAGAEQYKWHIEGDGVMQDVYTTAPTLQFVPANLGIENQVTVSVCAVNSRGTSSYSPPIVIKTFAPPVAGSLLADCRSIVVRDGDSGDWYLDGKKYKDFPVGEKKVYPTISGTYYNQVTNVCASVRSNSIDFSPFKLDAQMIPNVFTPNEDPFNEYFKLDSTLEGCTLEVLSRDGRLVFRSLHYSNNWNGGDLPSGIYFYLIHTTCLTDPLKGVVSILR